jgi:hypothetical protein
MATLPAKAPILHTRSAIAHLAHLIYPTFFSTVHRKLAVASRQISAIHMSHIFTIHTYRDL